MTYYEELIIARQESTADDCSTCEHLTECRNGKRKLCIFDEITEIIPAYAQQERRST